MEWIDWKFFVILIAGVVILISGLLATTLAIWNHVESRNKEAANRRNEEAANKRAADKDSLLTLRHNKIISLEEESKKLALKSELLSEELKTKADSITRLQHDLIVAQRETIEENEYRNFRSGIDFRSHIEPEIREWYRRAREAGFMPQKPNIVIVLLGMDRQRPAAGEFGTTYVSKDGDRHRLQCWDAPYPNVSIWRGLSNILLGKQIIEIQQLGEEGLDIMMYQGFPASNYDEASLAKKKEYWADMFFYNVDGPRSK